MNGRASGGDNASPGHNAGRGDGPRREAHERAGAYDGNDTGIDGLRRGAPDEESLSPAAELLASARGLVARASAGTTGLWPRASALLARQALEVALRTFWSLKARGTEECSLRAQLLCLGRFLADEPLARRAHLAWAALSRACHHHPYDLPPTQEELLAWCDTVGEVVARTERVVWGGAARPGPGLPPHAPSASATTEPQETGPRREGPRAAESPPPGATRTARIVPDEMPPGRSLGERRLFTRLQDLPGDCLVYYEPLVANRYPDFVVIAPDLGLLVIECKGWRAPHIVGGDGHSITIRVPPGNVEEKSANPMRQARDYMYRLMDECRRHREAACLLNPDGEHKGRFVFPFGYCVVLSQITEVELTGHPAGDLRSILPRRHVIDADEFESWGALTGDALKKRLADFFDPTWRFPPLSHAQVDVLRAILHPENALPRRPSQIARRPAPAPQPMFPELDAVSGDLRVLDASQEQTARSLGSGHRLLFGVAGSGKTVVLASRARFLSRALPTGRVLVLCFNVVFRTYLREVFKDLPNVQVYTFHGWGTRNGIRVETGETAQAFGERLLAHLGSGQGECGSYDAVLVDEGQDFEPSWYRCVLQALREPLTGDLLIVGDGSQTAYRRNRVSWKSLGIRAQGRTRYLARNYRNTRAIAAAAAPYAGEVVDEDGIPAASCDPSTARRDTPLRPMLVGAATRDEEYAAIVATVRDLLAGTFAGQSIAPLAPGDIGVLYRRDDGSGRVRALVDQVAAVAPTVWLNEPVPAGRGDSRQRLSEPGVKVLTIHAAKGLQFPAVVLAFADQLGGQSADEERRKERRLLYVALTRPEDYLAVTYAGSVTPLVREMAKSGAFERVGPSAGL